jgi:hypothetical protein
MDRWLESLRKIDETPASQKPASALNVESIFQDLLKVSDDDESVAGITISQTFDSDVPTCDAPDPVATLIKTEQNTRFRIPEISAPHEDGIEVERCGAVVWKFHWKDGRIGRSECFDPELPGGYLCLDKRDLYADGRHNATAHFASVREHLDLIDTSWEELLGGAYPEREQEIYGDSKKKAAASEVYNVGGEILAKGQIESRMLSVLARIRPFCVGEEAKLIEKAARALDFLAFGELAEPVLERMKKRAA